MKTKLRERGKVKIRKYLQKFDEKDTVSISIDPSHQQIPHPRFQGKTGPVVGKQGRAYFIAIKDGGKQKKILVSPEHLTKIEALK